MNPPKPTNPSLGPSVPTHPALLPTPHPLTGHHITLTPLSPSHTSDLFSSIGGPSNASLWTYMLTGPYPTSGPFHAHIAHNAQSTNPFFYTILSNTTGKALGNVSLMAIDPANRSIEIGHVIFSPALQRTPAATEVIYLLTRFVFEDLNYRRYVWKCNDLNEPSKRSALRLGFTPEGVFRQHMIVKGHNRDTAWFSLLDGEWPAVKRAFEAWLDPGNFDEQGRQRVGLAVMREKISSG